MKWHERWPRAARELKGVGIGWVVESVATGERLAYDGSWVPEDEFGLSGDSRTPGCGHSVIAAGLEKGVFVIAVRQ